MQPERVSAMETEYNNQLPTEVIINGQALTSAEVLAVARHYAYVALGDEAILRIRAARAVIDRIAAEDQKVYGVTTGFGHLSRVRIAQDQLEELQHNLLQFFQLILRNTHPAQMSKARGDPVHLLILGRNPVDHCTSSSDT